MTMDECSGCKFYRAYKEAGTCHRFPPAAPAPKSLLWALSEINWFVAGERETINDGEFDPEGQRSDDNDRSLWPLVYAEDWCGEFSRSQPSLKEEGE